MADIRQNPTVIDDFNRAAEIPLSNGGRWSGTKSGIWYPMVLDDDPVNMATHHDDGTSSDSYWNVQTWDGDQAEAWGCPVGGNASGIAWALDLWTAGTAGGSGTNISGYRFRSEVGIGSRWVLRRHDGSSTGIEIASATPGIATGLVDTRMLIRRNGGDVEGWVSQDAGANWSLAVSKDDSTYTTDLYLGIGITDNSSSQILGWGCFGGGGDVNRTQIYRWIKN